MSDFNNDKIVDLMGYCSVEKVAQTKMMIDTLNSALKKLTKEEREFIERIYYRDESLRYLAKLKNISHQAMAKRKNKILEKLRKFYLTFK